MDCPRCGHDAKGVSLVVGFVKVTTFHCGHCKRVWRVKTATLNFDFHLFTTEAERLLKKYPGARPPHVSAVIEFLHSKIEAHNREKSGSSLRDRRNDLWERQFLKKARGEDW